MSRTVAIGASTDVPPCTSVDSGADSNGLLNCARRYHGGPGHEHGTFASAVQNLLACAGGAGTGDAGIVGHGYDGRICTGAGDADPEDSTANVDPATFLSLKNQAWWSDAIASLRGRIAKLVLIGCHTGTGPRGADFLFEIATLIDAPCRAPIGWVYCNDKQDLDVEGGLWQEATPTQKPPALRAPSPYIPPLMAPASHIVGFDAARVVHLELRRSMNLVLPAAISWSGTALADAMRFIEFDKPFTPPGPPAACLTGTLVLVSQVDGVEQRRAFAVYNNRLVQDLANPQIYYRASILGLFPHFVDE